MQCLRLVTGRCDHARAGGMCRKRGLCIESLSSYLNIIQCLIEKCGKARFYMTKSNTLKMTEFMDMDNRVEIVCGKISTNNWGGGTWENCNRTIIKYV